jgi:hypothetical protein
MTSNVKYKVQWLFFAEWTTIHVFDDAEEAASYLKHKLEKWRGVHQYRMVWERQRSAA